MIKTEYQPDYVSPPGASLFDILEERDMSQAELARRTGLAAKTINEIVSGKAPISSETALMLERVIQVPASFWLRREAAYRTFLAYQKELQKLKRYQEWTNLFPVLEMIKMGWIEESKDPGVLAEQLLSYFGIASPDEWEAVYLRKPLRVAFRKARVREPEPYALHVWLRRGEFQVQHLPLIYYDRDRFRNALNEIRSLTRINIQEATNLLKQRCAECGVAVALTPQLAKTPVCGASRWLSPKKALIQLTLRYKTNDNYWFSFFHEAGHLLLHNKKSIFIDLDGRREESHLEDEADRFASNTLIPPAEYVRFVAGDVISHASVREFADSIGIASGIVVGRLQFDKHIPFSHLNALKTKLAWSNKQEN